MAQHVSRVTVPDKSRLTQRIAPGDFTDAYACTTPLSPCDAAAIATRFPVWVYALLALRQLLVLPFRLKGAADHGDRSGIFPIAAEYADELILGFDDRHLDFRISLLKQGDTLTASTWVRRHNWLGRAYLTLVWPFHVLIMRHAVGRVARAG